MSLGANLKRIEIRDLLIKILDNNLSENEPKKKSLPIKIPNKQCIISNCQFRVKTGTDFCNNHHLR